MANICTASFTICSHLLNLPFRSSCTELETWLWDWQILGWSCPICQWRWWVQLWWSEFPVLWWKRNAVDSSSIGSSTHETKVGRGANPKPVHQGLPGDRVCALAEGFQKLQGREGKADRLCVLTLAPDQSLLLNTVCSHSIFNYSFFLVHQI